MIMTRTALAVALISTALVGCDWLGPRASDVPLDGPPPEIDAPPAVDAGPLHVLPPGSTVPSVVDNPEMLSQIQFNDGLDDDDLADDGGVVVRSTGKASGATVRYWDFGTVTLVDGVEATMAPIYILADSDGLGGWIPRPEHPPLIDSIPGDPRYSAFRRISYVPVTTRYAGELLTSIDALAEAFELGLIEEPQATSTWQNMPVVPPGTTLELGGAAAPMAATEVFGRGHRIGLFPLYTVRPLPSNNRVRIGHASRLRSGVATINPVTGSPYLSTSFDAQPVFSYGDLASANYSPAAAEVHVQLATGVAPADISSDAELFRRNSNGSSITGYYTDTVASYVITTTASNKQIQLAEGSP